MAGPHAPRYAVGIIRGDAVCVEHIFTSRFKAWLHWQLVDLREDWNLIRGREWHRTFFAEFL